jgi:hypothetical protein
MPISSPARGAANIGGMMEVSKAEELLKNRKEENKKTANSSITERYAFASLPSFEPLTRISEEDKNYYSSSEAFLYRLQQRISRWESNLPDNAQPVIIAILTDGTEIRVLEMGPEGHNGIVIQGLIGNEECIVVTHQNTTQLLCFIEKVEQPIQRRPIGFIGLQNQNSP